MLSHYTKKWTKMSTTPLYKKCCPTIHVVHNQTQSKKNVVHIAHEQKSTALQYGLAKQRVGTTPLSLNVVPLYKKCSAQSNGLAKTTLLSSKNFAKVHNLRKMQCTWTKTYLGTSWDYPTVQKSAQSKKCSAHEQKKSKMSRTTNFAWNEFIT